MIQCIPNVSEGRDTNLIKQWAERLSQQPACQLIRYDMDSEHHRTVFNLVGEPAAIVEAMVDLASQTVAAIDLRDHAGEHPRMGVIDVVPLVPLEGISLEECVEWSRILAQRIWQETSVPVYLYEASATAPHRQKLADLRRGEFEGLKEKMANHLWQPDYGTSPHPSAGAIVVGAREALLAFNVNLHTSDLNVAKQIAGQIRQSSGGYQYCQAIGMTTDRPDQVQISMNIMNYHKLPLFRVLETIRFEAARHGVAIAGTEVIGLIPTQALVDTARYYLQAHELEIDQLLDHF